MSDSPTTTTTLAVAPTPAVKAVSGVATREENGVTIHSAKGVDLISTDKKKPGQYVCLRAFPQYGYKVGQTQWLPPHEGKEEATEHLAITLAALVAATPESKAKSPVAPVKV